MIVDCTVSPKRSTTWVPLITWPSLYEQAGEGMQRAAAAASENSALERLESGLGNACSQAEESLSLCNQDQTGRFERSCFGWFSRPFLIRLAQVLSLSSEIFPLVLPSQELSPTQPTWTLRFSWGKRDFDVIVVLP